MLRFRVEGIGFRADKGRAANARVTKGLLIS